MNGYNKFIELIKDTRKFQYDCTILSVFAGDSMAFEDDEFEFENSLEPLLLYFDTTACDNISEFRKVIDLLNIIIVDERKLDQIDVHYVLNEEETNVLLKKFSSCHITKDVLFQKLQKIFKTKDVDYLIDTLKHRWNIENQF